MSSGPDDERRHPSEPTFADVMNGFSFDAGKSPRRRRWGRRRGSEVELGESEQPAAEAPRQAGTQQPGHQQPGPPQPGHQQPAQSSVAGPPTAPIDMSTSLDVEQAGQAPGASAVRPYAWTRGRTKSGLDLAIETLVSTSQRGRDQMGLLQVEHRAVAELCEQTRSVAEVAALLSLPLGVARVLLGDMAGLGMVTVHQTATSAGNVPDLALMERVLSGLRRL
jgi:hypothetical protein